MKQMRERAENALADEIRYIESMSSELARLAERRNNAFLAYLLKMAALEARERILKETGRL